VHGDLAAEPEAVRPPDVFIAGDNAQAKAGVEAFIERLGLRPLDVGDLKMAHWLEGAGLVAPATGWGTGTSPSASPNFPAEPHRPLAQALGEQGRRAP
jgi:predicted dinucleotide-binding enzyme